MRADRAAFACGVAVPVLAAALLSGVPSHARAALAGEDVVAGHAVAGGAAGPVGPVGTGLLADVVTGLAAHPGRAPAQPATPAPAQPATPGPAAPPAEAGGAGAAQPPGTVRLPRGGTATLVRREVGPDAVLPVPDGVGEATWWGAGLGASSGATVFAGHVNWRGATGPFAELWDAKAGDTVTVVDAAGGSHAYRVTRVVTLGKDDLPRHADELFAQDGPHRLVLVTCGGTWVGGAQGYESNRVVVATPA